MAIIKIVPINVVPMLMGHVLCLQKAEILCCASPAVQVSMIFVIHFGLLILTKTVVVL